RRELGVEPSEETLALVASLQILALPPVARSRPELEGDLVGVVRAVVLGGGVLDVETLARVLERQALDVADDLAHLEQQGWLDQHLVPDAELALQVANGTPAGVKRLLHQRIAQALADSDDAEPQRVARHLLGAGRPAAAAPLLLRAAETQIGRSEERRVGK